MGYENYKVLKKDFESDKVQSEFILVEKWCSENKEYIIRNDDEYVYVCKVEPVDKQQDVRSVRDSYLQQYVDEKFKNVLMWNDMSEEEKQKISAYRRYLLDYTKKDGWEEQNPMPFNEWIRNNG